MCRAKALISCIFLSFAISSAAAEDDVTVRLTADKATIENSRIQVEFDLARGIYGATDKRDGSIGFREGCVRVGDWTSTRKGIVCRASERATADGLGTGRTLAVECVHDEQPTLVAGDFPLPRQRVFSCSARESSTRPSNRLRIKEFYPLTAARAFPEVGEIHQAKTLNARRRRTQHFGAIRAGPIQFQQRADDLPRRQSAALGRPRRIDLSRVDEMGRHVWPTAAAPSDNAVRQRELSCANRRGRRNARRLSRLRRRRTTAGTAPGVQLRALRGQALRFRQRLCRPLLQHRAVRRQASRN